MLAKRAIKRAQEDKKEGKAPTTQAGNFVREEMDQMKKGTGAAKNPKQAIAIGLSEARKAGVKLPPPKQAPKAAAKKKKSS